MGSHSFVIHTTRGFKQAFKRTTPAVIAGVVVCSLFVAAIQPLVAPKKAAAQGSGLSIVNNQLYKDGKPYLPRGFNMIGLLTPDWCSRKEGIAARDHFTQTEMDAAKAWNANTLRFQMSQRGLADTTLTTDQRAAYLQHIQEGVSLARSNGFTVILSMQEQGYGCGNLNPLPTSQTIDAWSIVGDAFKTDPYVMFELYNEPNVENDTPGWEQWRNGGTTPLANNGFPAVGHQTLVEHLRSMGVPNVLIADGARKAARLSGMPLLSDPANQLMYGIHPYYYTPGETWWHDQYGYLAGTVPLIATEWNYLSDGCGVAAEQMAPDFLQYLKNNNIGLLGHALDTPGITIADWTWAPTECGTATGGSGKVLKDYFATQTDPDVDNPAAPANLTASPEYNRVTLNWEASTATDVASYQVVRDRTVIATVDASTLTYTDTTVTANTTYTYAVVAVDSSDNLSEVSNQLTITTPEAPDTTAPTTPTNLKVYIASPTDIRLSWNASSDNKAVTNYRVARDGWDLANVAGLTYADTRMSTGKTHTYKVYAQDAAGNESAAAGITVIVPAVANSGLTGTYFDTAAFGTQKLSRIDSAINFAWGTAAPAGTMGADTFSVRWTGKVIPVADETYTFYTQSDDGVRLWVNGQLLIDNWTGHTLTENSASITLKANQAYDIKLEYYENTGSATIKLLWSSPSVAKDIIPTDRLLAQ